VPPGALRCGAARRRIQDLRSHCQTAAFDPKAFQFRANLHDGLQQKQTRRYAPSASINPDIARSSGGPALRIAGLTGCTAHGIDFEAKAIASVQALVRKQRLTPDGTPG
jgi:hypothetical protein